MATLASFPLYLQRFLDLLEDVSQFYNTFQSAASALEKISGVLEEEPSVAEPLSPATLPAPLSAPLSATGSGRGVRFDSVRFGYRKAVVLPRLDLDIPAGQTVALVGETGRARPRSPGCSRGSTTRTRGRSCSTASTCGRCPTLRCGARWC
jgi:ATP-binding cassette, subfamily B, bacterial